MRVPVSPHPRQHSLLFIGFIIANPVVVKRCLIVVCICLMTDDVELFFHVLIGHLYIFSGEMFAQIFGSCFNWVVCLSYCWVLRVAPNGLKYKKKCFTHYVLRSLKYMFRAHIEAYFCLSSSIIFYALIFRKLNSSRSYHKKIRCVKSSNNS